MQNVPPNLHRNQGVNHLNKVLDYAPIVADDGQATVHLTPEDWHVVLDTLFYMDTPIDELPQAILKYELVNESRTIRLHTEDCLIDLEQI